MNNIHKIHSRKIYLFDYASSKHGNNTLKEFIYFIKSRGISENIDFSYSNSNDSLHCHLSVKENLILDSIPTSLIKNSELNLNQFLNSLNNKFIKYLFELVGDLNQPVSQLNRKQIKIASIIKVILSNSKYIFLNNPDEFLEANELEYIKQSLYYEADSNKRIIMFKSQRKILWPEIVTNIITKGEKLNFIDTVNPLSVSQESSLNHEYTFTLNKKVS